MRILVADDDRVTSLLLCSIVQKGGHVPIPAYDAMQAVMFAMRSPAPSLIILDLNMPGGAGVDTLRKLKLSAKSAPIPVIVVSGNTEKDIAQQVRGLGAEEFIPKPVDPEALLSAIRRVTGQPTP